MPAASAGVTGWLGSTGVGSDVGSDGTSLPHPPTNANMIATRTLTRRRYVRLIASPQAAGGAAKVRRSRQDWLKVASDLSQSSCVFLQRQFQVDRFAL